MERPKEYYAFISYKIEDKKETQCMQYGSHPYGATKLMSQNKLKNEYYEHDWNKNNHIDNNVHDRSSLHSSECGH